jgi:hypothetical protein
LTSQTPKRRNGRTDNGRFILFRIKDHSIASEAPGRAFRSHLRRRRAKADPLPDMSGIPDDCCAAHSSRLPDLPRRLGESSTLPFAFVSERGPPFCKAGFARMNGLIGPFMSRDEAEKDANETLGIAQAER